MKVTPLRLPGLALVQPRVFEDERGWFMESWNAAALTRACTEAGVAPPEGFAQDNHSHSRPWVLRGLHYQLPPHAQGKLVRVVRGAVWDVAVDLRRSSPTFGQWEAALLSAANAHQLWIPAGFAHGFLALGEGADVLYKATAPWHPASERCLLWDDATVRIDWPLPAGVEPVINAKDRAGTAWGDAGLFD
jgi:dTDP-4-dehydrorhamnose 3,5-epimerase